MFAAALLNFYFVHILYLNDHLMVASPAVVPARRSIKTMLVVRHFYIFVLANFRFHFVYVTVYMKTLLMGFLVII